QLAARERLWSVAVSTEAGILEDAASEADQVGGRQEVRRVVLDVGDPGGEPEGSHVRERRRGRLRRAALVVLHAEARVGAFGRCIAHWRVAEHEAGVKRIEAVLGHWR